jgi:hypothetical protein
MNNYPTARSRDLDVRSFYGKWKYITMSTKAGSWRVPQATVHITAYRLLTTNLHVTLPLTPKSHKVVSYAWIVLSYWTFCWDYSDPHDGLFITQQLTVHHNTSILLTRLLPVHLPAVHHISLRRLTDRKPICWCSDINIHMTSDFLLLHCLERN